MSNYFKTIEELLQPPFTQPISKRLLQAEKYYAHVGHGDNAHRKKPETLEEHVELVQEKCKLLCKNHGLDGVIDGLIFQHLLLNGFEEKDSKTVGNFIKKLFVDVVVYHDYGKINENFQAHPEKMNNPTFKFNPNSPLSTHHSALGAYIYIVDKAKVFYFEQQMANYKGKTLFFLNVIFAFSYAISKHHAKYLDAIDETTIKFKLDSIEQMAQYLSVYQIEVPDKFKIDLIQKLSLYMKQIKETNLENDFALYQLVRLSFSLLTASDYLATGEYMSDILVDDFGVLSRKRIEEIYQYATQKPFFDDKEEKTNYNKRTYEVLESYGELKNPKDLSGENLNVLRQEMAIELIRNLRQNIDKQLFYIEAPTGGGKTNLSMLATIELLKNDSRLTKVYYVFPFTTLITQTYASIKETLGLSENEIVQLHSKAGFKQTEETQDGVYGNKKLNYIDNLFVNYPFCLLSHVKFFDLLKTNAKEENYLLHRLANAVVVIDELQSYNPLHWDKVIYFVKNYAITYNVKFILMSATLPKIDKLVMNVSALKDYAHAFVDLIPQAKQTYFQNPNFAQRVRFDFSLLEKNKIELAELATVVLEKSNTYSEKDGGDYKPLGSVYTIIEFIFKKTATAFYHEIKKQTTFFDEIFVLSGTILEHRRKFVIDFLKKKENRKKKILLITTQVVEAGVDIDMDLGFKNQSLMDSDEQLAGRINRNVNKQDCELYLFYADNPRVLYGKDKRYEETKKLKNEYREILQSKDFDRLYDLVLANINEWNNTPLAQGFDDYQKLLENLNFRKVHEKFMLIEQKNISVFVPLNINKTYFSSAEIQFLTSANAIENENVVGKAIFDLYVGLVENKKGDFITHVTALKTLQGIMSKFVFSIFDDAKGQTRKKLIRFANLDKQNNTSDENDATVYGFIYLEHYYKVYDEKFGLSEDAFDDIENCFL